MEIVTPKGKLTCVFRDDPIPEELEGCAFVIDKPMFWSSFDVVRLMKWSTRIKKIGHAGTLDPLATGVLVCLIGRKATRHAEYLTGQSKKYTATIELGKTTLSYDSESEIDQEFPFDHVNEDRIREVADSFLGEYEQEPPMYSAKKVGGERLYKKARRGETVHRKKSPVTIKALEITDISLPKISMDIDCSKGTYIRCIANDFGKRLGSGSYLSALERTQSGDFGIQQAWNVKNLSESFGASFEEFIKPKRLRALESDS